MLLAAFCARTFLVNGNARCSSKYHSSSRSSSSENGLLTLTVLIGPLLNRTTACQPPSISPRSCMLISCAMPTSPYSYVLRYIWICASRRTPTGLFVDIYRQNFRTIGFFRLLDMYMPMRRLRLCLFLLHMADNAFD